MLVICFHCFLTVFCQVRALIFSLEMETESSQKCPGVTDEGLTLEVQGAISPRRRRAEQKSGLVLRSTCLEWNCLDLCPTLSALSDVGMSLTLTLLIGQLEIVVFIGDS